MCFQPCNCRYFSYSLCLGVLVRPNLKIGLQNLRMDILHNISGAVEVKVLLPCVRLAESASCTDFLMQMIILLLVDVA